MNLFFIHLYYSDFKYSTLARRKERVIFYRILNQVNTQALT